MTDTPWHFWIIVTIAILWHGFGAFDYTAIQYDWAPWLVFATGPQEQFAQTMPAWVDAAWALSVWTGLLGALMLAVRMSLTPLVLSISMLASVVLAIWISVFANPTVMELAGWPGLAGIWIAALITVLLWIYARDMHKACLV
ncbi:hypothetical protein PARPLA_02006 [Rhodobacteraceae bacterium THAF1]|uniref:hypothetical protein n=1 Tax=Palleronia sp. THAF1 TaxID=2587842 RepID=UPI000F3FB373|nr:hypothetical protein [Palleronia sp. THAF1]QFU08861.1 hypothetical protein FIU81_09265 [Palleronia sp. THAF1]VDC24427.1 hypothetical protein PARPLA_02006 [Rhodobacteraceae bacterium THAF1]